MYVKIENLKYRYSKSAPAVIQNFSLAIKKGEIVSILGESGSGKSTILRLLAGLETPSSGSISIDGNVIVDGRSFVPPEKRKIGIVFQDYALFPHMTVEKNIKYGLRKMSRSEKQKRLDEMLELISLEDYKNRYPHELSGGQQQRVALARALAPAPSLLLFDEPFSNLDAHLQVKIRNELREILKHTNTTSVFVTHDQTDAVALADRIILLENGIVGNELKPFELGRPNYTLQYQTGVRA